MWYQVKNNFLFMMKLIFPFAFDFAQADPRAWSQFEWWSFGRRVRDAGVLHRTVGSGAEPTAR